MVKEMGNDTGNDRNGSKGQGPSQWAIKTRQGGRMTTIIGLSLAFIVLSLLRHIAGNTYRRRVHLGQVKALFDVLTSVVALGLILSVFAYIAIELIYL